MRLIYSLLHRNNTIRKMIGKGILEDNDLVIITICNKGFKTILKGKVKCINYNDADLKVIGYKYDKTNNIHKITVKGA